MKIDFTFPLLFSSYNSIKQRKLKQQGATVLGPGSHMLAGAEAGVLTLTLTNPIWVAKTRLCLQYDKFTKGMNYM